MFPLSKFKRWIMGDVIKALNHLLKSYTKNNVCIIFMIIIEMLKFDIKTFKTD